MMNYISKAVIVAVILNLVLPLIVKPFATPGQIKPKNGAQNLSYFDQLVHMLVHHAQVPITSSIIVAVVIGLSMYLAKNIPV